jgi:hypothetical protein
LKYKKTEVEVYSEKVKKEDPIGENNGIEKP